MKNRTLLSRAFLAAGFTLALPVQAALEARYIDSDSIIDAVYDTDQNITWLANANLAASNTFGLAYNTNLGDHNNDQYGPHYNEIIETDGSMTWGAALHWIDFMNAANYLGNNDWRLPVTPQPDLSCSQVTGAYSMGNNCTGSEMGHLFYAELGGMANNEISNSIDPDLALFANIQEFYWSGSEETRSHGIGGAWAFTMSAGFQGDGTKDTYKYALAVHDGSIGLAAPVPESEAYALMLAGLGLVGFVARRRKQQSA